MAQGGTVPLAMVLEACVPLHRLRELARRFALSPKGFRGMLALIWSPLADAQGLELGERALRDALAVVVASYEYHGGFRLRTLAV